MLTNVLHYCTWLSQAVPVAGMDKNVVWVGTYLLSSECLHSCPLSQTEHRNAEGRTYWFNPNTKESSWEKPEGLYAFSNLLYYGNEMLCYEI